MSRCNTMRNDTAPPSPALQAANTRLLALRAAARHGRTASTAGHIAAATAVMLVTTSSPHPAHKDAAAEAVDASCDAPAAAPESGQKAAATAVSSAQAAPATHTHVTQTVVFTAAGAWPETGQIPPETAVLPVQAASSISEIHATKTAVSALSDLVHALPPHLGWDSTAVTQHLRQGSCLTPAAHAVPDASPIQGTAAPQTPVERPIPGARVVEQGTQQAFSLPHAHILLHPTLALALLRQGRVAEGRLWLLLRWLDGNGRGWLTRADIEAAFSDKESAAYLCTPRYLRQLLAAGEGLFWRQDSAGKLWLRGQAEVAAGLGVTRLTGRVVLLPVSVLFRPIGEVRAHCYASFHSSRGEAAAPISRETLRDLSGASPRAQQAYEQRARVRVQSCVAVGGMVTAVTDPQDYAWQHGRAAFTLTDHQGRQGKPGRAYQARRLPNRYVGPHLAGQKPRRLNRQLAVLCHQGDAGNGRWARQRRYYADGAAAVRGWAKAGGRSWVYWVGNGRQTGLLLWQEIAPCPQ